MQTLHRYIFREALLYFSITLSAFTGILLTLRILHFTALIVNKGVALEQVIEVFISIIPTFLELAVPMAAMLGVLMAFARLSGDSEIIVMRASGVSLFQLIAPVLLIGTLASALGFGVSLSLKPWGAKNLSRVLFEIARSKSTSGLTEGVFNSLGSMTLYAEKINFMTGELSRVVIDDRRPGQARRLIFAKAGLLGSNPETKTLLLQLYDGEIHEIGDKGRYVRTEYKNNELAVPFEELEGDTQKEGYSPREMRIDELDNYIELIASHIADSTNADSLLPRLPSNWASKSPAELKRQMNKLKVERAQRFSMPCASLVLALIALPLGIMHPRTQRTWGTGLSLVLALSVFMLYYGSLTLGISLAEGGKIEHDLGVWIPNILIFALGTHLTWLIASERLGSVADVIPRSLGEKLIKIFRRRKTRASNAEVK